MTPETWRRVEELYHSALERAPGERATFLSDACGDDEGLRQKIESLVDAHEDARNFLEPAARSYPPSSPDPTLDKGTQAGPYEIVASIGRGGMGQVYRARDTRLGREVALKILPNEFSTDQERLKYFEQEARAASGLNHPNIVTIYDIGQSEAGSYISMELVDGLTLRQLLKEGLLPAKKLLNIACQVADGLARAHAAGIVHRDLKPENLMVRKDGLVKILDFGVAKLVQESPNEGSGTSTIGARTPLATILGTAGYMSPEQVRGQSVGFRSDQFSFGSILYEMSTGKRAFHRDTDVETLSAIINDEPESVGQLSPRALPQLRWIIERCLAKEAEDRYAATIDLARDLATLRDHLAELTAHDTLHVDAAKQKAKSFRVRAALTVGVAIAAFAGALVLQRGESSEPSFQQLTFANRVVTGANFAPDGKNVIYSMNSNENISEIFTTRLGSPGSRSLNLSNAGIFDVSPTGEMAIAKDCVLNWGNCIGTLALAPLSGGAPKDVLPNVHAADWGPDGKTLAVAQFSNGMDSLQYPIGHSLYETLGWIGDIRVSPQNDAIAFLDHPVLGHSGGSVVLLELAGNRKTLSTGWTGVGGLIWARNGKEIWFTGSRNRAGAASLYGISRTGHERQVLPSPRNMGVRDISHEGRLLLINGTARAGMVGMRPGEMKERDLSWFDYSTVADLSADGQSVLFYEWSAGVDGKVVAFWRSTDGADAVRLGDGKPLALSPDKKWALALRETSPAQLVLLPTSSGKERLVPRGTISEFLSWAAFSPDSQKFYFAAVEGGKHKRTYVQDIHGGMPEPITSQGFVGTALSPDGELLAVVGKYGGLYNYSLKDQEAEPLVNGFEDDDTILGWAGDNDTLFVRAAGDMRLTIFKVHVKKGARILWRDLKPPHPAGLVGIAVDPGQVRVTPNGGYAYTYWTFPSELYALDGVR
jgi:serine/threonine protein kinase